ncbi:MAG: flagellin B [Sulfuricurvum sp. PD_MW2]|uniref:flagellin B n=1 Tax=Sulfuricurvum sp. PD_MW2 TaxID=2027917 RepID=UPI000C065682|nr:flagellin B [Sulfuricurvum sp. PD_MW2]PHM18616.1 MAG: flagellin B [Sulfuricurvum sp. PD_MW2]
MGFKINTNVAAMNAHTASLSNNRSLDNSLAKLSSGLRINTAADDASGMAIADSLRAQSSSLGQAVSNANDAIGIVQIADKAMDEQLKILETIKVKATQAAQDGQSADSRKALQADISRLIQGLDNIANTTNYNGQNLLSGSFTNKQFQVGAYSNQTIDASIGATQSTKIGNVSYYTGLSMSTAGTSTLTFSANGKSIALQAVAIDYSAGSGIGKLADVINNASDQTGVRASYVVETVMSGNIAANTDISGLTINGVNLGNFSQIAQNDKEGVLVNAINAVKEQTGVTATIDTQGQLHLKSNDGRGIHVSAGTGSVTGFVEGGNYGKLTLSRLDARAIVVSSAANDGAGLSSGGNRANMNLASTLFGTGSTVAVAIGGWAYSAAGTSTAAISGMGAGVTTLKGAMAVMNIAESAQKLLDSIRSDLGSVQNQLTATVNNISVTQVNVKAAESNIRDVDFAAESATFAKYNILAQSGSYAMSQANAVQQNVLRLLQ